MVIAETEHYVLYHAPIDPYYDEKNTDYLLKIMEKIRVEGYRPIHYENRQKAYVCEKLASVQKAA